MVLLSTISRSVVDEGSEVDISVELDLSCDNLQHGNVSASVPTPFVAPRYVPPVPTPMSRESPSPVSQTADLFLEEAIEIQQRVRIQESLLALALNPLVTNFTLQETIVFYRKQLTKLLTELEKLSEGSSAKSSNSVADEIMIAHREDANTGPKDMDNSYRVSFLESSSSVAGDNTVAHDEDTTTQARDVENFHRKSPSEFSPSVAAGTPGKEDEDTNTEALATDFNASTSTEPQDSVSRNSGYTQSYINVTTLGSIHDIPKFPEFIDSLERNLEFLFWTGRQSGTASKWHQQTTSTSSDWAHAQLKSSLNDEV